MGPGIGRTLVLSVMRAAKGTEPRCGYQIDHQDRAQWERTAGCTEGEGPGPVLDAESSRLLLPLSGGLWV